MLDRHSLNQINKLYKLTENNNLMRSLNRYQQTPSEKNMLHLENNIMYSFLGINNKIKYTYTFGNRTGKERKSFITFLYLGHLRQMGTYSRVIIDTSHNANIIIETPFLEIMKNHTDIIVPKLEEVKLIIQSSTQTLSLETEHHALDLLNQIDDGIANMILAISDDEKNRLERGYRDVLEFLGDITGPHVESPENCLNILCQPNSLIFSTVEDYNRYIANSIELLIKHSERNQDLIESRYYKLLGDGRQVTVLNLIYGLNLDIPYEPPPLERIENGDSSEEELSDFYESDGYNGYGY